MPMVRHRQRTALALAAGLFVLAPAITFAQQPGQGGAAQQRPPASTPRAAPAQPQGAPAADAPRSDSALRQRIEQLEEQIVDLQQAIGTLESIAKSGGSGAQRLPAMAPAAGDDGRMAALEQQVRALATQVETLSREVRSQGAGGVGRQGAAPVTGPAVAGAIITQPPQPGSFATTVTTNRNDPIGQILGAPGAVGGGSAPVLTPPPAGNDGRSSKDLYEIAYGLLLQQDYAAAEAGFEDFLRRFPNDPLAGNAQYWLGETHYVRENYKASASAFLKGYQAYGRSSKAPDSLLKLAMSLDRLGQRDAACSSYGELNVKFPNAPQAVRARADQERRRLGCV
jgi:tol-pal system protein YbgF